MTKITLGFKVYDACGILRGAVNEPEAAAAILSGVYHGGTIRFRKKVLYRDGLDGDAGDSFDEVARICWEKI